MDEEELTNRLREIRRLEQENGDARDKMKEFQRVSDLGQDEIRKLKAEYERERRDTLANEEGMVRKLKALDDEKTRLLRQVKSNDDKAR